MNYFPVKFLVRFQALGHHFLILQFHFYDRQHISDFICILMTSVPPGAPNGLEVVDVDAEEVTLTWMKPRQDGGSKVTGYTVEYKSANSDEWIKAPSTKDTTATVSGLRKGEKYTFRVSAKNSAGTGEPSQATRLVLCKPKYGNFAITNAQWCVNFVALKQIMSISESVVLFDPLDSNVSGKAK